MKVFLLGVLKVESVVLYLFQRRQTLTSTLGLLGLSRSRKSNTLSSSSVIVRTLLQGNRAPLLVDVIVPVIQSGERILMRMTDERRCVYVVDGGRRKGEEEKKKEKKGKGEKEREKRKGAKKEETKKKKRSQQLKESRAGVQITLRHRNIKTDNKRTTNAQNTYPHKHKLR